MTLQVRGHITVCSRNVLVNQAQIQITFIFFFLKGWLPIWGIILLWFSYNKNRISFTNKNPRTSSACSPHFLENVSEFLLCVDNVDLVDVFSHLICPQWFQLLGVKMNISNGCTYLWMIRTGARSNLNIQNILISNNLSIHCDGDSWSLVSVRRVNLLLSTLQW